MTSPESFDRELRDRFVRPFYLQLLGGNFTRANEADSSAFGEAVVNAASAISDEQIARLLIEREWRGRLCAAWFVGLRSRAGFVPSIGKLLLASETVYAGQGYCIALGLIGSEECSPLLRRYLTSYLPLNGRVYNQNWAIGALAHLEGRPPAEFLEQALWRDGDYFIDPAKGIESFSNIVSYLRRHRMINGVS